jgi:hypothetical protein
MSKKESATRKSHKSVGDKKSSEKKDKKSSEKKEKKDKKSSEKKDKKSSEKKDKKGSEKKHRKGGKKHCIHEIDKTNNNQPCYVPAPRLGACCHRGTGGLCSIEEERWCLENGNYWMGIGTECWQVRHPEGGSYCEFPVDPYSYAPDWAVGGNYWGPWAPSAPWGQPYFPNCVSPLLTGPPVFCPGPKGAPIYNMCYNQYA